MSTLFCCHVDDHGKTCDNAAEFRIIDNSERRWDSAETHACTAHVGELIGHAPDVEETGNGWTVLPIEVDG